MKDAVEKQGETGKWGKGVPPWAGRQARAAALTPDVGLDGEFVVRQAFGCSPLDGEFGPGMGCVSVPRH